MFSYLFDHIVENSSEKSKIIITNKYIKINCKILLFLTFILINVSQEMISSVFKAGRYSSDLQ